MDVYTEIYLRFKNVQGLDTYSDEYEDLMEENNKYLENLFANRSISRAEEIRNDLKNKFGAMYESLGTLDSIGESKYYFFDRTDNPGYSGYKDSINCLGNIASVLPVFFF